jgi:hypothetical protein
MLQLQALAFDAVSVLHPKVCDESAAFNFHSPRKTAWRHRICRIPLVLISVALPNRLLAAAHFSKCLLFTESINVPRLNC